MSIYLNLYMGTAAYKLTSLSVTDRAGLTTMYLPKVTGKNTSDYRYLQFTSQIKDMTIAIKNTYKK